MWKLRKRLLILAVLIFSSIVLKFDNPVSARTCQDDCHNQQSGCLILAQEAKDLCYANCDSEWQFWYQQCLNHHCGGSDSDPVCANPCIGEAETEVSYCKGFYCDSSYSSDTNYCSFAHQACLDNCPP